MKIKTISVEYERKLNTGDYSSVTLGLTFWADLDEGDDPDACTRELYAQAKVHVKEQAQPFIKKQQAETEEIVNNLTPELKEVYRAHQGND